MAVNRPVDIIDAILSNPELRNTLTRAVEASGSDRQVATHYNAVEQEVSTVFCPNQQVPVAARATPPVLPQVPLAPIFQMRRNYASQRARRCVFVLIMFSYHYVLLFPLFKEFYLIYFYKYTCLLMFYTYEFCSILPDAWTPTSRWIRELCIKSVNLSMSWICISYLLIIYTTIDGTFSW